MKIKICLQYLSFYHVPHSGWNIVFRNSWKTKIWIDIHLWIKENEISWYLKRFSWDWKRENYPCMVGLGSIGEKWHRRTKQCWSWSKRLFHQYSHDSLAEDVKGVCCWTPIKTKSQPPLHIFSERPYQNKTRQVPFW